MRHWDGLMAGGEETNEGKVEAGAAPVSDAVAVPPGREAGAASGASGHGARKVADLQLESVSRRVERIEHELRVLREQLTSLVARAS